MTVKIGLGYDIHRLVEGRRLVMGGLEIPFDKGLLGHSDADVLIHAICDALLGALNLGDIGELFPDTDSRYKDMDSRQILIHVKHLVDQSGFYIGNIDTVVILEKPSLRSFKKEISRRLSEILSIPSQKISVKAKTQEGLGLGGSQDEAVAVYATVVLMDEKESATG
jgi:2-C-methyl-D-erythritol 2,4-cyclodiphosphate synthase